MLGLVVRNLGEEGGYMYLERLKMTNYTVFREQTMNFSHGVNIFVGENGTGKTHVLKLLYSACQAINPQVSFAQKVVMTMLPDDYNIKRLISRGKGNQTATVRVAAADEETGEKILSLEFSKNTRKWDASVTGESGWEEVFAGHSSIFIPAEEILSHNYNLRAAVNKNNVRFDDTYLDILDAAKIDISAGRNNASRDAMLKDIEKIIGGTVVYDPKKEEFYLKVGNSHQEFNLVAEGIRKMGLLWQLVKNGTLEKGSALFWDEPEANINPSYISIIVKILLELQRRGVQIFLSTHDYMLANYFLVQKTEQDQILYHSLAKEKQGVIAYEQGEKFGNLKNNPIIEAFDRLLDEIYNM